MQLIKWFWCILLVGVLCGCSTVPEEVAEVAQEGIMIGLVASPDVYVGMKPEEVKEEIVVEKKSSFVNFLKPELWFWRGPLNTALIRKF